MEKHKLMGTEKISKLLLKFSVPAMIGMIVNGLYNVVDRYYIGKIPGTGHFDIAGVGLVMPIMTIAFAFAMLIGMGGSTLISLKLGEKKLKVAEKYLGNGIFLGILLSTLLALSVIIFKEELALKVLKASTDTYRSTVDYMGIIAIGFPFLIIGYTANIAIRSDGSPIISMGTILIGAILNIILDPILIFQFNLGVKGAAVATIVSQLVSMVWAVGYFRSRKSTMKLKLKYMKPNMKYMLNILKLGLAPASLQLGSGLVMFTFNNSLKKVSGDYAISAMTIVQGINMFFVMPIFGINQGLLPIAGYNYGAKLYSRVKEALKLAIFSAMILSTTGFILIQIFSENLIRIFTENQETLVIATSGLRIYTIMAPFIGFQVVSSIYFQAIGKPKLTMFLTLSRQVLFLIPLVLILSKLFGEAGVWLAAPVSDVLSSAITFIMIKKEIKDLNRLESIEVNQKQI